MQSTLIPKLGIVIPTMGTKRTATSLFTALVDPETEPAESQPQSKPAVAPTFQRMRAVPVVLTTEATARAKQDSKFNVDNGVLNGTVRLRDTQGNELSNRRVETKVHLSIEEEGAPVDALEPLYRRFAVETANLLTGAPAES
jgi:hypothetical protein